MNDRPHIVLVRHGQSVGNLTGDYGTNIHDNLTKAGWGQARRLADRWEVGFDRIVVSPLGRTRQTALPTLERFQVKGELWPDLAECCWQEPRSLPPTDPELPLVPLPLEPHETGWFDAPGPVGAPPDFERYQDGLRRMRRAAQRLDELCRAGHTVLAFSHGYAISKLVILLTGRGHVDDIFDLRNAGLTRLVPGESGLYVVEAFDEA